jgi:hypothetical protein
MRVPLQSRIVTDPQGVRWRVSVRWTPWWPRLRFRSDGAQDTASDAAWLMPDGVGVDLLDGCLAMFAIFLVLVVLIAVLPFLLFAFEVALLIAVGVPVVLLLAAAGVTSWRIEVEHEGAHTNKRRILETHRGLLAADAAIYNLANQIQSGDLPLPR